MPVFYRNINNLGQCRPIMARRKITPPALPALNGELLAPDLPQLTPQQVRFVELLLSGKTASDAYRGAYDCSNMANTSIWTEAARTAGNPKISLWLGAARKAGLGAARVTYESHVTELERLREIALETGNVGAAVQAEQLRGKAAGQYVERVEIKGDGLRSPVDDINEIAARYGVEIARAIALREGIAWIAPDEAAAE